MRWQIGICGDEHMGIKLGNICRFQSGGTPAKGRPEFFNGTIPWITTTALNGGNIGKESAVDWICEQAIKESAAKIVPAFSIMVGTRVGVGKVAINTISMSTSQDIVSLLDIDESIWSKAFLCKFLQAKGAFLNAQARGATIKGIKIDVLSELELPEIPIEEQQHISQIIDKVKTTIAMRQSQLQKLDKLVKARFVEMFGDPIINPKGHPVYRMDEVVEFQGGSQPDKKYFEYESTEDNIRLVQIRDYKTDKFITYIPKSMAKRFCTADDIMIGRYGPPIFQILQGIEGSFNVALMKATPKIGNREFIRQFLKQECLLEYLEGMSKRTAGQDGVQMDKLKAYATTFTVTVVEPYKRWEFDMENSNMKGHWIGVFIDKGNETQIDFTENVIPKKWFMKPFVKTYLKKQQKQFVLDLKKALE